jgi:hypothetical protein
MKTYMRFSASMSDVRMRDLSSRFQLQTQMIISADQVAANADRLSQSFVTLQSGTCYIKWYYNFPAFIYKWQECCTCIQVTIRTST